MEPLKLKTVVDWIITASCLLRCDHCIVRELVDNARARKDQELNTIECKEMIDWLWEHGARALSLTGGEVLTRKDLFELIDYARARGLKVYLYTTGLPFVNSQTGELRTDIVRRTLGRIDFLGISLDTFHNSAYQQIKPKDYCEQLISVLYKYATQEFPNLQIQLFTVLGKRNGGRSVEDTIADCNYVAGVINIAALENKVVIRWRLSPFRFNPSSMLWWQKKLLFTNEEYQRIKQELQRRFGNSPNFTLHFGVDYDSFFVYPDGKFRTVQLDENGIDRFIELGTFRDRVILRPDIWQELYEKDGQTAKRMRRTDILKLQ